MPVAAEIDRRKLEEAFALGEANVRLEGFEPGNDAVYRELKERVLSGELTAAEMTDEILAHAAKTSGAAKAA